MSAGMMTNTLVSAGVAFADVVESNGTHSENYTQRNVQVPFENLGEDGSGGTIKSISLTDDGKLNIVRTGTAIVLRIYGSDSPTFSEETATQVDLVYAYQDENVFSEHSVSSYPDSNYYYIVNKGENQVYPMARINGENLGNISLEDPYVFGTDLKGTTTPNATVYVSDKEDFSDYATAKADDSGNFTFTLGQINVLAKHTPGTTLYVKSDNSNKVENVLIHYPTPKVDETYAYDTEIKGTAYPNSKVFISDSDFGGYVTVEVDASGNFTAPVSLLKSLTDYESGNTLYFKNSESDIYSQAVSLTSSTKITENQSSITANDFTLEYGADFNDQIAIEKAGATATDANGNEEGVKVKESNVDTSKPGEYSVTFISDSRKEKTVKVTVNDVPEENATITANDFTLDYGAEFNDTIAIEKAGAKATDKYGKEEGVKVKESNVDTSKSGEYSVTFISDSRKEKTVKVTVNDVPEENATITANDFTLDYGAEFNDTIAIEKAGAKATDKYGKEEGVKVKESNVDTSKPGEYSVTFISDSGKEKTVKVTVKEAAKKADTPVFDQPYYYNNDLKGKTSPNAYVDIRVDQPATIDFTVQADENGNFTVPSETLKKYSGYQVGRTIYAAASFGTTETVSSLASVTIESQPEILTVDPVYEDSEYITGTLTKGYTAAIIAYDSNNKEVAVAGINESTNGTFKLTTIRKLVPGEKLTIKNFESATVPNIKGKQITVQERNVAPTLQSEKEIHVPYGSDWSDEIAKEQAKVKATDGKGNDVTKDVKVTSNPVDTSKPGNYTVEFSVTENGLTATATTTVIVDEQEKDYLLEPNEYVIGKDTYITGKAGADVKFVALYKEENGKRVFYKRAPVTDGQIKVYAGGLITDKDQVIYAVAEDENHQTITVDGKNVEKQVALSELGEGVDYQLSPDEYVLGTHYITGVYDNDQADRLRLRVDGKIVNTIYPDQSSNQFKMYASSVTSTDQKVDVLEYQGDELLTIKPVTIKEAQEITYNLSANDYNMGDAYVTGTYDNEYADTVKLIVDGKVVKLTHPDSSQTSYKLAASSFIDSADQEVVVAEYNGTKELTRVNVNVTQPKTYEITPDTFELGKTSLVTGTWNSDDDSVKYINLYVNDQRVSINALNEDGTFSISTKNTIKTPTDKVELQLADASKVAIGEKVPVTVQKSDYQLSLNDYTLNDTKVTGTFDSRYTTNKDQLQLIIDGKVAKQVVYSATDTAPGKENEEFAIVAKGLITDKNQKVIVRHIKDGKKVVEQNLTIQ